MGNLVTIRFTGDAERCARERFPATPLGKTDSWYEFRETDKGCEVTVKAQTTYEIISEVLRWGSDAEVISPPDVRDAWLEKVSEMSDRWLEE